MTEEERNRQGLLPGKTSGTYGTDTDSGGNKEEVQKSQDVPVWKKATDGMRKRAESLRQYSQKPVETDTEGQTRPYDEFLTSRLAQLQETDEERERREKRERTGRRLSALADGLVALSNVTGAMFGATPLKQTSLSAAHRKSVQEALERRKENARHYETARRHAVALQLKQDAAAAKRRDGEAKARREAAKQADSLDAQAARLELQGSNADRRAEQTKAHYKVMEEQGRQRIAIAAGRKGRSGSGNSQADFDEYARWEEAHPNEVNEIRENNAQIDPDTHEPKKSVTTTIVKLVNAKMRRKYGTPPSKRTTTQSKTKKSVQGFGSGTTTKKKKIAGFGTK